MLDPIGFWSYARHDDEHSDGELSALRVRVGSELKLLYGEDVVLWQDVNAIPYGTDWKEKIAQALNQATFFIPIVTPRFFKSEFCVEELERFRSREKALGRSDLIFPLQFIDISDFRSSETRFPEVLAFVKSRQIFDFEPFRGTDHKERVVRQRLNAFAKTIRESLRKQPVKLAPVPPPPPPPPQTKPQRGWLADLLERAARDEEAQSAPTQQETPRIDRSTVAMNRPAAPPFVPRPAPRPAAPSFVPRPLPPRPPKIGPQREHPKSATNEESIQQPPNGMWNSENLALDLASMVDGNTVAELWRRFLGGERNGLFTPQLYNEQGRRTVVEIRRRHRAEAEFRATIDNYIGNFEELLTETQRNDCNDENLLDLLCGDAGKVYTLLGHAAGRFDDLKTSISSSTNPRPPASRDTVESLESLEAEMARLLGRSE